MITVKQVASKHGEVYEVKIQNSKGAFVEFFSLGAAIKSIFVPDKNGVLTDVVLGYDTPDEYIEKGGFYGVTVGRYANRIIDGKIKIDDKEYTLSKNNPLGTHHGGFSGFNKKPWKIKSTADDRVTFSYLSPDGEEGFPSNLTVEVEFIWDEECNLFVNYYAVSDGDTVINLTNHSYFNLNGCKENILDTTLKINSDKYTGAEDNTFPNGKVIDVENTALDFRTPKKIGKDIKDPMLQFDGYDHNYCLPGNRLFEAAEAECEKTGITLKCKTTMPGVQLYTYNGNTIIREGKGGVLYGQYWGFCLETQNWPGAINFPHFPSSILRKGEEYKHSTIYSFSVK